MTGAIDLARRGAEEVVGRLGSEGFDFAVVLGSGWTGAAGLLGDVTGTVPAAEIPGFREPAVAGHTPTLRAVVTPNGRRILVLGARHHYYESRDASAVVHGVAVAAEAGCTAIILTNAAGSTRQEVGPGSPVLITDHINLTGASPLTGPSFVDMTDAYSPRLRALARAVQPDIAEGVYAQFAGPQYETPAEVRMATTMGASLVGMSTALETIAARAHGMEVLGLSLVTNLAAGVSPTPLSHGEVLAAAEAAGPLIAALLADTVARM